MWDQNFTRGVESDGHFEFRWDCVLNQTRKRCTKNIYASRLEYIGCNHYKRIFHQVFDAFSFCSHMSQYNVN